MIDLKRACLRLSSCSLVLAAAAAPPPPVPAAQPLVAVKAPRPAVNPGALALVPDLGTRTELLAPGKTQGTFRLNGVVGPDKTVILRWANDRGEMPLDGVIVYRQKVGDTAWKELNARKPVAFFRTDGLESRLRRMDPEKRETLLSLVHSDVAREPVTGRRQLLPGAVPKGAPQTFSDVKLNKVNDQFRTLRATGRLAVADLHLMNAHADLDPEAADAYGLAYRDRPGSGQWRYRIRVNLPEGGAVEAECPKVFDPSVPTPIPPPQAVSTKSGNGSVLLDWKAPEVDTVAAYNVYRADNPNGPWRRVNVQPVKLVALTAEDPELTLARANARSAFITREMQKIGPAALTPDRVGLIRAQATDSLPADSALPALPAAQSQAIKAAVAAGRLHGAGPVKALSVYTDSITDPGNGDLVTERTYLYKVVSVDITGAEGKLAESAPVAGIPKDLQPPVTPGRPMLAGMAVVGRRIGEANALRLKDPQLAETRRALALKAPGALTAPRVVGPLYADGTTQARPAQARPAEASAAPVRPEVSALSVTELRRMTLSRTLATMPVKDLEAAAEASVLRSNPDGSVPPADLVWAGSPDGDLREYTVYRSTNKGPMARMATVATPAWKDASLEAGKAYTYVITATDQLGNESPRSAEWTLQVCDSSLAGRLAVKGLAGKASTGSAPGLVGKRFLRPADRVMATTGLDRLSAAKGALKPAQASSHLVAPYAAPKRAPAHLALAPATARAVTSTSAPAADTSKLGTTPSAPASGGAANLATSVSPTAGANTQALGTVPARTLTVPVIEPGALKAAVHLVATRPIRIRGFNPMLAPKAPPTEIHVRLTWERPLDGMPVDYTLWQAPQDVKVTRIPRPAIRPVLADLNLTATTLHASSPAPVLLPKGGAAPAPAAAPAPIGLRAALPAAAEPAQGRIITTSALHLAAARLDNPGAAVLASSRKDMRSSMEIQSGPGAFIPITTAPVATESYVVAFPAEAAQYGGATFYFRIQAHTREFGKRVDGPISEPIEVRLPDIVAPPAPDPGTADLHETAGAIDVNLMWTQTPAKDLAGTLVERQAMDYKLVDGVPQPTTPQGTAAKLTPDPVTGLAFKDAAAPAGFQRYTFKAVDQTGNVSAAKGHLDILVPGEPVPQPPQGVVLNGDRISWQPAKNAHGYSVWRSFTGKEEDYDCISPLLPGTAASFDLPALKKVHLRVVARSASGMHQVPSEAVLRP